MKISQFFCDSCGCIGHKRQDCLKLAESVLEGKLDSERKVNSEGEILEFRNKMWDDFAKAPLVNFPWLSCGHFNCITNGREKKRGAPFTLNSSIFKFNSFLNLHGLIDLGHDDNPFTWTNNHKGNKHVCCRLDRAVPNCMWIKIFGNSTVQHLPRGPSDHNPLLISIFPSAKKQPTPFRFRAIWNNYQESKNIIHKEWTNQNIFDPTFEIRLRNIRHKLTAWNKQNFSKPERMLNETHEELKELQMIESFRTLSKDEELRMLCLSNKAKALARQINIKWHTLAKCNWIKLGEANNKFYHNWVTIRQRVNFIGHLYLLDGSLISDSNRIRAAFVDHYKNLWEENNVEPLINDSKRKLLYDLLGSLVEGSCEEIRQPFSVKELNAVISDLKLGKSRWVYC